MSLCSNGWVLDRTEFEDWTCEFKYDTNSAFVKNLGPFEEVLLNRIASILLPKSDLLTETPDEVGLMDQIDQNLEFITPNYRFYIRVILKLFNALSLFRFGRTFRRLTAEKQEKYVEMWRDGFPYPFRIFFKLISSLVYTNYYANPAVCKKIGFEIPPIRPKSEPLKLAILPDKNILEADVCIIGSGAGGAVVAKELAEKGRRVIVLEEGKYRDVRFFDREPSHVTRELWYNGGLQTTLGVPCILLPTGSAVGGTTITNSGTCFRLPEKVLERWRQDFGLLDLNHQDLIPHFEKVEKILHVGPVTDDVLGRNAGLFKEGLEKLGLHGSPLLRNTQGCQGAGRCFVGCPNDAKQSMQLTYLPQAIQKGAQVFANCRAEKIISKGDHGGEVIAYALNPQTNQYDRKIHISAKVIVLAAGTLNTPRLLRRNHIASHNPHIGRHMTIHPTSSVYALFDEEVKSWQGVLQGFSYEGMEEEGILFEGVSLPPSIGALKMDCSPRRHREIMENYRYYASFGFLVSDEGRGWIRWLPNGDPVVYYSLQRREIAKFVKGLKFMTEVFFAAGAKSVLTGIRSLPEITAAEGVAPFDRLKARRSDFAPAAFHPLGTCRMGSDPAQSVVDSYGEVHNMKNLFIADGSIFPSSLGVNPQETIMAFATRIAEFIDRERF